MAAQAKPVVPAVRNVSAFRLRAKGRWQDIVLGGGAFVVFVVFWQMADSLHWVNPVFIGSPVGVYQNFLQVLHDGTLGQDMVVSGTEFLWGYGLSILVGVPFGILIGWYRPMASIFRPFISGMYSAPRIALIPLFIIWLGIGIWSKVALAFLSAVFPIIMNAQTGVRTVDQQFLRVARSYGATDRQIFSTVVFPSTLPFILAGLRLGVGHALIGVVVGELYGSSAGLGYLIASAGEVFKTNLMLVGVVIVTLAGIMLIGLFEWIENFFQRWRTS